MDRRKNLNFNRGLARSIAHRSTAEGPMAEGFSTIELMIAMTIMVLVLTAVILVSFGNQSFLIGSQTNAEAMKIAQRLLEQEQALARKDFNLVNSIPQATEDIYKKEVFVKLLPDFLTKEVKALITWKDERQLDKTLELTTLIANFETPVGGNTCDSTLSGDWTSPQIKNSVTDFATLVGDPDGVYTLSDVDAYKNKLYVTADSATDSESSTTLPTLFVFDVSDPTDPDHKGDTDNAPTATLGLNAVRVSEDPAGKTYAYAASNTSSDYSTCDPVANRACGQFVIFDVSNQNNPSWATNLKVTSLTPVTGTNTGQSIFYKNGYVLLGLSSATGPEFHIVDIHNPDSWFGGTHLLYPVGSFEVGNWINEVAMRGTYAYLGTPNTQELQILDLTNPNSPALAGGFSDGSGNGKGMYLVGNNLYFGKTTGAGDDLFILDNTSPGATLPKLGGFDIGSSVNDIIVRDYLSFILTNNNLEIYRTDDPSNISFSVSIPLPASGSATEPSMDCEGNNIFVTSNDGSGRGELYIISTP